MHNHTAIELNRLFNSGALTARQIVDHCLARITQHDGSLGCFLRVYDERARAKADELDAKRRSGAPLGKLAGVPVAVKDNIHVQGELTTCGSRFLANFRAPFDATATRLLEAEDAIIVGKTNLDEFAMGSSTEHSALGLTRNPWDSGCVPGGSSGGSTAAVAARLVPLALGSDTGGSIRQPAAFCGVVGYKPTYGRVSRYGLVAFGSSLDQIGPFARTSADAALAMEVLGRQCLHDATSLALPPEDYGAALDGSLHGLKIGVPWHLLEGLRDDVKENFTHSMDLMQRHGAVVEDIDLDIMKYAIAVYYIIATAEASTNLARFDGIRYGVRSARATTLKEVYEYSKEEGYGAEVKRRILLGTFVLSAGYQDAYYRQAQKVRTLMLQRLRDIYSRCQLIAMPVTPTPAFEIGAVKDPLEMYLADIFTITANLCGVPAVSVPSGLAANGMPLGLQLLGPQKHDALVLRAADAFEKLAGPLPCPPLARD